ncbi:MAG: hypothetical protein Ta2E_13220 [Mycoplasmoidaceae bacterium]|nr:MAG: hypothetical protein Ta2E_13220 [Mycoplasmoidaceae bacterium]
MFITFHPKNKSKTICVQPYVEKFRLPAENAGNITYPSGGISMRTWNDELQYNMLLDTLNLNNNSLVGLPLEFYTSWFHASSYNAVAAAGFITRNGGISNSYISNFLLGIPFAADGSHMESLSRAGSNVTWIIEGITNVNPFASNGATIRNMLALVMIVISVVCDWYLIVSGSVQTYHN